MLLIALNQLLNEPLTQCTSGERLRDAPWRAQVSVGAYPSFAKVRATIQESNDARPLGDAPSRNSSRDWNGTLACSRQIRAF